MECYSSLTFLPMTTVYCEQDGELRLAQKYVQKKANLSLQTLLNAPHS
jgi:hypothetical protein